ncbi:rRNA methyltransferase 1, mitochondrial-like isoform X2 [Clytia hemisphaerica]
MEEMRSKDIKVVYKSKDLMNRISGNQLHQSIILSTSTLNYKQLTKKEIKPSSDKSFWLALDRVQDPMNLGAIIRTASYFGVEKLIVTEKNSCALSPVVSKASSGAMEWNPVHATPSMKNFLKTAVSNGFMIYGTQCSDKDSESRIINCQAVRLDKPCILVLGNEGSGLDEETESMCHHLINIQSSANTPNTLDSLNVSVAAGILLHALSSNRKIGAENPV